MSNKQREVYGSENVVPPLQVSLFGCIFLLLLQRIVICCPSTCHICSERQVNCRNLGLNSIPRNFPKTATLIYLSGNNLTSITPNELTGLKVLAVLYLNNSNISYIHPKALSSLQKLYYLYLNDNYIQRLDVGIFDELKNLHYLHLQQNQIDLLPQGLFLHLRSVRYLTLQKNRLRVLGSDVFFGMTSLYTLNLANNNISRISDTAWRHLEVLENLYLDGNHLMQVPSNALGLLKGLKRLSLSNNQIGSIHNFAFRGLNSLHYLFLENTNIQAISDRSFSGLGNLKQLILSQNGLRTLDSKSFTYLKHLVSLQLDKNGIDSIADDTFEEMGPSLKVLNLAFNNFTTLQPKVLQPLISLSYLQANNNPWDCGCDLVSLRKFLLASSFKYSIHCQSPLQLRNRPLGNVKMAEFQTCVFTTTDGPPKMTSEFSVTTTAAMYGHMKSATSKPFYSSQSTERILVSSESTSVVSTSSEAHDNTTQATDKWSHMDVSQHHPSMNLTEDRELYLPPDIVPVSLNPVVICQQRDENLNQSFHILLSFFLFACAVLLFLTVKIIQLKRKCKTPESQGDSVLEYYSCYQSGRYQMTDPGRITPLNPLPSPEMDLIRPLKQSPPDAQTQVILFEHSAL